MVQTDGGDDADPGIQHVGGVQPPTQSYLYNLSVNSVLGKALEGHAS